jgi:hypothetical protein
MVRETVSRLTEENTSLRNQLADALAKAQELRALLDAVSHLVPVEPQVFDWLVTHAGSPGVKQLLGYLIVLQAEVAMPGAQPGAWVPTLTALGKVLPQVCGNDGATIEGWKNIVAQVCNGNYSFRVPMIGQAVFPDWQDAAPGVTAVRGVKSWALYNQTTNQCIIKAYVL